MTTATLVSISFTSNLLTGKSRLRHGYEQVHHSPFSNLNFINHIDSSLGCSRKWKHKKLKTLVIKNVCTFIEKEQVNHRIDLEHFDSKEYAKMLQESARRKSVRKAKQIHAQVIKKEEQTGAYVGVGLVHMYGKCGDLVNARLVFDKLPERTIVTWTAMVTAYIQNGHWEDALKLVGSMHGAAMMPDDFTFSCLLGICAKMRDPRQGKMSHGMAIKTGFDTDVVVESALIDMYGKCNLLMDARRVLEKSLEPNVASWTAMIRSYVRKMYYVEAINLFCQMQWLCIRADAFTLSSVLTVCAELEDLQKGKQVHAYIIKFLSDDVKVWPETALITMYSKTGVMKYAFKVFERMSKKTVVSWTSLIAGYGRNGRNKEAIEFYKEMQLANMKPNSFTFFNVLAASLSLKDLRFGKQIHAQVLKTGLTSNSYVESAIVNLYAKFGHTRDAHIAFDHGPKTNLVLWCKVVTAYAEKGNDNEALSLFNKKRPLHINRSPENFAAIVKACTCVASLKRGTEIHAQALKSGLDLYPFVGTSLIDMYSKCGNIDDAFKIFTEMPARNPITWNAMIGGCARKGHNEQALNLFRQLQVERIKPDEFIFSSIIGACTSLAAFELGKQVHVCIIKGGYELDGAVQNTIAAMYAKLGFID